MNIGKCTRFLVLNCCVWTCLSVSNTFSQSNGDEGQETSDPPKSKVYTFEYRERLQGYEENYVIWQRTQDDERSFEAHYSLRYLLTDPHPLADDITRTECFLSYTGEFDFYAGTRESGPVINRISNPGAHLRRYVGDWEMLSGLAFQYFEVGFEHRSNGQTVDADDRVAGPNSQFVAQARFLSDDHEFFDGISRGSNFLSLKGRLRIGTTDNKNSSDRNTGPTPLLIDFSVKPLYISSDSNVTWGPLANSGIEFSDYDRGSIAVSKRFSFELGPLSDPGFSVKWTLGDKGTATDSFDIGISLPIYVTSKFLLPLYVRYHDGPMSTLSNYTKEQNSIGIGLNLSI